MATRRIWRVVLGLALALGAIIPSSAVALASCAIAPPLPQQLGEADAVFVGTVRGFDPADRTVLVDVHEVWRGPDLPSTARVRIGPAGGPTSVDRQYTIGSRYLFAPSIADGVISDDACSATREYDESLAAFRPADAREPLGGEPQQSAGFGPAMLLVAGIALIAAVGVVVAGSMLLLRRRAATA